MSASLNILAADFTRVDVGGGVMRHRAEYPTPLTIVDDDEDDDGETFLVLLERSLLTNSHIALDADTATLTVAITDDDEPDGTGLPSGFALHSDNGDPKGIWSDGTTMWCWTPSTASSTPTPWTAGGRDTAKEFSLPGANGNPTGVWSNGTTIWVADASDDKLYAYTLDGGARDESEEFGLANTPPPFSTNVNGAPAGIWSDGTTFWVADSVDNKFYAYTRYGVRDKAKEFALGTFGAEGAWSDGTTMWLADASDDRVYARTLSGGSRDSDKDISVDASISIWGIWSDGATMWVVDRTTDEIYTYALPRTSNDATLSGLSVRPVDLRRFDPERTTYHVGVGPVDHRGDGHRHRQRRRRPPSALTARP